MKKILAFFLAILMFAGFAGALHLAFAKGGPPGEGVGTWVNMYKDLSYSAISDNLTDDMVLVLGSSELQHGRGTEYHASALLGRAGVKAMLVGAAYNQCLSHAITTGAVAPGLKSGRVVLILSPAWFDDRGVRPDTFDVRFSETEYTAMLRNPALSADLKRAIAQRSEKLLSGDKALLHNVKKYNRMYLDGELGLTGRIYVRLRSALLTEAERIRVGSLWRFAQRDDGDADVRPESPAAGETIDWDALAAQADSEFAARAAGNPYHMDERLFRKKFARAEKRLAGSMSERRFPRSSPEYGDLELFLRVCSESGLKVELILLPVNGYWYDRMGFTDRARSVLPEQIKEITDKYGAEWCSFYDEAYDEGFLEDAFHPAGKGWVRINEAITEFCKEQ